MTEHKELVDRLRGFVVEIVNDLGPRIGMQGINVSDVEEAARVIEEQAAEIARLRGALMPFSDVYVDYLDGNEDQDDYEKAVIEIGRHTNYLLNANDFRTARKALTHPPETGS